MIDTVLFDLDGTLTDSVPLILKSSKASQEKMGIPWDEAKCRAQIGAVIKDICVDTAGNRWEEYLENYQYFYETFFRSSLKPFAGIKELLSDLEKSGVSLGVVTSRRRHGSQQALDFLDLKKYFPVVITSEDSPYHKPHPAPARTALDLLGKRPEQAVFVGDTPYDVGCGLAAGCKAVAVAWGAGLEEDLKASNPHKIVYSVGELRTYLLEEASSFPDSFKNAH